MNRNEQRSRVGGRGRGKKKEKKKRESCAVSNLVSKVLGELPQHCRICKQLTDSINQWLHNAMHTIQNTYILMKGVGAKGDFSCVPAHCGRAQEHDELCIC